MRWFAIIALVGIAVAIRPAARAQNAPQLAPGEERHLSNLQQLTRGGENAEAYWSPDGKQIIYMSNQSPNGADQIFTMNADGSNQRLVSTGKGRCTCGYYFDGGKRIVYSSTHHHSEAVPPPPDRSKGYVWPIYDTWDLFIANADGSNPRQLTTTKGYDAEQTVSPDGKTIVFTSVRDGDLDLYTMGTDGSRLRRLTNQLGYDGGPFFSHDGRQICYRANHPTDPAEVDDYKGLLARNLVRPTKMEIFVMKSNGSEQRQLTRNDAANFAPCFTPDDKRLMFSTNLASPNRRAPFFDLFIVPLAGGEPERVTFHQSFNAFPMFSPDGKKLLWTSSRGGGRNIDIFVADWKD